MVEMDELQARGRPSIQSLPEKGLAVNHDWGEAMSTATRHLPSLSFFHTVV